MHSDGAADGRGVWNNPLRGVVHAATLGRWRAVLGGYRAGRIGMRLDLRLGADPSERYPLARFVTHRGQRIRRLVVARPRRVKVVPITQPGVTDTKRKFISSRLKSATVLTVELTDVSPLPRSVTKTHAQ